MIQARFAITDALTRAGLVWTRPPYASTPADIATDLNHLGYEVPTDFTRPMSKAR